MSETVTVTRNELPQLSRMLRDLGTNQIPFAAVAAMTRTAQAVQADLVQGMRTAFDRPTRWTLNSLFVEPATKGKPEANVHFKGGPGYRVPGRGVPAGRYLAPQILGGQRADKTFEKLLGLNETERGAEQGGYIAVPGRFAQLDAHGNLSRGLLNAMMASLDIRWSSGAVGRAGTRRRGAHRAEDYFLVRPSENDAFRAQFGLMRTRVGAAEALPPGIYRRVPGSDFPRLVVRFVRQYPQSYAPRLDFAGIGEASVARHLPAEMQRALSEFPPRRAR